MIQLRKIIYLTKRTNLRGESEIVPFVRAHKERRCRPDAAAGRAGVVSLFGICINVDKRGKIMRVRSEKNGLSVHAISGSYVIILGFDIVQQAAGDNLHLHQLLGFAIYRIDHTENEEYWLNGFKTFKGKDAEPGKWVSTRENPIQAFMWGDYTAKPKHEYTYRVVPIYGTPDELREGESVEVRISTEDEDQGTHAVFFNRGACASQAYALKFKNKSPEDVPDRKAYIWLSRGLEEAILSFIGQAKGRKFGLRASVYEFNYAPVLDAFKKAADSGADVKIVYDARDKDVAKKSDDAIELAGIRSLMIKRTTNPSFISHNKFIILLENGKPREVWTGSTNFTEGGIFGQSNVGHIVRDPETAKKYDDYWNQLKEDPEASALREWTNAETPVPKGGAAETSITPIFSPRPSLEALEWYANCLAKSEKVACFTAAFGINKLFTNVLDDDSLALHYVLADKDDDSVEMIRTKKNNLISVGGKMETDKFHRWLKERLTGMNEWVKYIHTKYMLNDPLGDDPRVISGSANFSDASTIKNDENMLVIGGDKTVADMYVGEFMRLFHHYYFRDVVNRQSGEKGESERESAYLKSDDSWTKPYFELGNPKRLEREYFR